MHISATIPLILGSIAGILFVGVFISAWLVTFRNRRIIKRYTSADQQKKFFTDR